MEEEPLLSSEETDALLDAMRASEGQAPPSVDSVDLTTADRGLRENLGYSDRAADRFCATAVKAFLRGVGVATSIEPEPTEITPYDLFRSALPNGAGLATLRSHNGSQAILLVGPSLVGAVLERRLGAPVADDEDAALPSAVPGVLSAVDRRVIRPFLAGLADAFASAWCRPGTRLEVDRVIARPDELPDFERSESLLRLGWRAVPQGLSSDKLHVMIPSGFLFDTGPEMRSGNPMPSRNDRAKLVGRIQGATVEMAAVLGSARTTVRDVLRLRRGDVLRLENIAGTPVSLSVQGSTVAHGQPCIHHGNMAVELVSTSIARSA